MTACNNDLYDEFKLSATYTRQCPATGKLPQSTRSLNPVNPSNSSQVALTHGPPHSDPRHITLPTRLCMEPTPSTLHGPAAHHTASTLPSTPLQFTATTLQNKGEATILECSSFASSCSRGRVPRPRKR